ncbi:MAG TPA: anthranilate synthase component I family protein [Oscillatoriaceae cyanobacterium]
MNTQMQLTPERAAFRALAAEGGLIPLMLERPCHGETVPDLFRRLLDEPTAFLLESLPGDGPACMGLKPLAVLRAEGSRVTIEEGDRRTVQESDPIQALRELLQTYAPASSIGLPRFAGAVGYFGYDTVRHIERLPEHAAAGLPMPEACWLIPGELVEVDPKAERLRMVHLAKLAPGEDVDAAYDRARASLEALDARLRAPLSKGEPPLHDEAPTFVPGMSREQFCDEVESLKEHIRAGDIFQGVLSQRFEARSDAAPFAVYEALRAINPSPYMYCLKLPEATVVGASPELLFRLEGETLTVRPIAGTRPRGRTPDEDQAHETSLKADPKELAEHVMLVDLGRNDVGRVAAIGSVRVADRMVIERYSHVMHLVSSVEGRLPGDRDAFDAFRATFPAGTLSGAPKIEAMTLIERHEPVRRGLYGGTVGYFGFDGDAQLAIAIRTTVAIDGTYYFQTGAGIVYDSEPEKEYQETLDKARALRAAITRAHTGK